MEATSTEQAPLPGAISPAETTNPWLRRFNRVFSRHLMNIAILMTLPMIFVPGLSLHGSLMADPDLWWHISDARILCTTHHFIHIEPYSFSVAGQKWVNPEWLAEVPYWLSYHFLGLRGIYLLTWLTLCANIVFVYWRGHWMGRHAGAAFWAAGIGFCLMTLNSGPRTIAFGYLAMSAELAILEASERGHKHLLWLLPPLFCVWINLHGLWFIGIGLLVLYILCGLAPLNLGVFEQESFAAKDRNRLLGVLGASVAALIVNPYGWRLVWNPLDMMINQKLNIANVQEWQPLDLTHFIGKCVVAAIGLMVVTNCIHARKWKLFEMVFVFLAWYAAFAHARFTFLAAVLTIPLLARDIERSFCTESDVKTIPAMNALIAAGALALVVHIVPTQAALQASLARLLPLQTIASIQHSWRTINVDNVGGMMAFDSKPSFIDSRFDTFEHHGVLKDFLDIARLQDSFNLLKKYRIDHALLRKDMPLCYLLEHTPGWVVVRREGEGDSAYELFAHSDGAVATTVGSGAQVEKEK
jgi:hypothetical protein